MRGFLNNELLYIGGSTFLTGILLILEVFLEWRTASTDLGGD
jgi:hypothetical protein